MVNRVTCPTCRTTVTTNADGTLRRHRRDGEQCPGGEATQHVALPWAKPLTQNQLRRMHPLVEAREKRAMSDAARWVIRAAKLHPLDRAQVTLHYRPPTRRLCDADGLAPTLKVALDALVREGVLPEDDYRHVPIAAIHVHPPQAGMPVGMWIEIEEAS